MNLMRNAAARSLLRFGGGTALTLVLFTACSNDEPATRPTSESATSAATSANQSGEAPLPIRPTQLKPTAPEIPEIGKDSEMHAAGGRPGLNGETVQSTDPERPVRPGTNAVSVGIDAGSRAIAETHSLNGAAATNAAGLPATNHPPESERSTGTENTTRMKPYSSDPDRIAALVGPVDDGGVEAPTSVGLEFMDADSIPPGGEAIFREIQDLRERFVTVSAHLDDVHRAASETPKVKAGKQKYEMAGRSVLLRNHPEFRQVLIRIDELSRELQGVDPNTAPETLDAVTRAKIGELTRLQSTVNHFQAETMSDPLMAAAHEVLLRSVIDAMVQIDPATQDKLTERDRLEARIRTLHQELVQMHVRRAINQPQAPPDRIP